MLYSQLHCIQGFQIRSIFYKISHRRPEMMPLNHHFFVVRVDASAAPRQARLWAESTPGERHLFTPRIVGPGPCDTCLFDVSHQGGVTLDIRGGVTLERRRRPCDAQTGSQSFKGVSEWMYTPLTSGRGVSRVTPH